MTCSECKWWTQNSASTRFVLNGVELTDHGSCRRNPPQSAAFGTPAWPITMGDDFCGAFEQKCTPE